MTPLDPTPFLDATLRIAAVATGLGALEALAFPSKLRSLRPRHRLSSPLLVVQAGLCLALAAGVSPCFLPLPVLAIRLLRNRGERWGLDGSDQMQTLLWIALTVAMTTTDTGIRGVALAFVGLQALLAYTTAGLIKLRSEAWREGLALPRILGTRAYGNPTLAAWLAPRPRLSALVGWAVVALECLLPIGVFLGHRGRIASLASAALFHLVTGHVMGLSGFLLTFLAAWPGILYLACCTWGA